MPNTPVSKMGYHAPRLVVHGRIADLTLDASGIQDCGDCPKIAFMGQGASICDHHEA